MKRQVFGSAVLLLVVLGAVLANAQSPGALVSNIPFSFSIEDVALPAGEYYIQSSAMSKTLVLSDSNHHSLFIPVMSKGKAVGKAKDELVFDWVNGQYFLASIWTAENSLGGVLYRRATKGKC